MKKIFPILIGAAAFLASCSEEDKFTPGAEPGTKGAGVYFMSYDAQNIIGEEPTIEDTLWFELGRTDTMTAIDVPIIVESKDEFVNVPGSVHFDVGDSIGWLGITYVGLQEGKESKLNLRIADEYANPYADKEGSTLLKSSILRAKWEEICDTLIMSSGAGNWPDQGCDLEHLPGMNRFRITNFLGSGQPLEFSFATGYNKEDPTKSKGEINPISNYYDDGSYWYFTNGGDYDEWTPVQSDKTVSYMEFYKGATYTFLDLNCNKETAYVLKWGDNNYYCDYYDHYSMMAAYIVYTDESKKYNGWDYLYFYVGYKKTE